MVVTLRSYQSEIYLVLPLVGFLIRLFHLSEVAISAVVTLVTDHHPGVYWRRVCHDATDDLVASTL